MSGIAGREGAVSRESYACNLGVAEVDRAASPLARGGERSRPLSGRFIEIQYAPFEVFAEHLGERLFDLLPAPAWRQERNAEAGLEHRDRCDPDRLRGLPVKPRCNLRIWPGTHQRREYVGVEDNHAKSAGRAS